MIELLGQIGETVGIAAVAGVAIGGAYKMAELAMKKKGTNGNGSERPGFSPTCIAHGREIAGLSAKIDSLHEDVRYIKGRIDD